MEKDLSYYLDEEKIVFGKNESGFCTMEYNGEFYKRVNLLRACPQTKPTEFISVCTLDLKEIGIIRSLDKLSEGSKKIAEEMLERRYFCPEITKFVEVKMRPGTTYCDCMFTDRRKNFIVKDVTHNIFYIDKDIARINDADGNRYFFNFRTLDKKSKKLIEPLLY